MGGRLQYYCHRVWKFQCDRRLYRRHETVVCPYLLCWFNCAGKLCPISSTKDVFYYIGRTSSQSFFGYRILLISHSFIIPVITWLGATVRFGFGIALAVVPSQFPNIQVFESQDLWIAITPLAVSVSNDVLSTASLSYYLSRRVENGTPKFAK